MYRNTLTDIGWEETTAGTYAMKLSYSDIRTGLVMKKIARTTVELILSTYHDKISTGIIVHEK